MHLEEIGVSGLFLLVVVVHDVHLGLPSLVPSATLTATALAL